MKDITESVCLYTTQQKEYRLLCNNFQVSNEEEKRTERNDTMLLMDLECTYFRPNENK